MRLISTKALMKRINCYPGIIRDIVTKELRYVPTVDAESVRHGHWIDVNGDGSLWRCSVCGETQCCASNYCGDCGAKMGEEKENE